MLSELVMKYDAGISVFNYALCHDHSQGSGRTASLPNLHVCKTTPSLLSIFRSWIRKNFLSCIWVRNIFCNLWQWVEVNSQHCAPTCFNPKDRSYTHSPRDYVDLRNGLRQNTKKENLHSCLKFNLKSPVSQPTA